MDLLSHIMLGAHMIQMALLYFVAPILLIRGLPEWVWKRIVNYPVIRPLFRFFTLPLVALAVFNSLFPLYHIPLIFDYSKSSIVRTYNYHCCIVYLCCLYVVVYYISCKGNG